MNRTFRVPPSGPFEDVDIPVVTPSERYLSEGHVYVVAASVTTIAAIETYYPVEGTFAVGNNGQLLTTASDGSVLNASGESVNVAAWLSLSLACQTAAQDARVSIGLGATRAAAASQPSAVQYVTLATAGQVYHVSTVLPYVQMVDSRVICPMVANWTSTAGISVSKAVLYVVEHGRLTAVSVT